MPDPTVILCLVNLLVTLIAIGCGLYVENDPRPFLEERSVVTWFSAVQLLGIGGIAWAVWSVRRQTMVQARVWQSPTLLWLLVALGFFFLAIDEVSLLHETLDRDLHRLLSLPVTPLTDRLDDLIVAGYGGGGIAVLFAYRAEVAHYRSLLPLLTLGLGLFMGMLCLDVLTNELSVITYFVADPGLGGVLHEWGSALEEGCKLMSEGVLLSLVYHCLCQARRLSAAST